MAQAVFDKTVFLEQLREIASGMAKGGEESIAGLIKLRNLLEESEFGYRTLDFSIVLSPPIFSLCWLLYQFVVEGLQYNLGETSVIIPESQAKPLLERISIHLARFIRSLLSGKPDALGCFEGALTTYYELLWLYEKAATGGVAGGD